MKYGKKERPLGKCQSRVDGETLEHPQGDIPGTYAYCAFEKEKVILIFFVYGKNTVFGMVLNTLIGM